MEEEDGVCCDGFYAFDSLIRFPSFAAWLAETPRWALPSGLVGWAVWTLLGMDLSILASFGESRGLFRFIVVFTSMPLLKVR